MAGGRVGGFSNRWKILVRIFQSLESVPRRIVRAELSVPRAWHRSAGARGCYMDDGLCFNADVWINVALRLQKQSRIACVQAMPWRPS